MAGYGEYSRLFPKKKTDDDWQDIIGTMPSVTEEQQAVNTPMSDYLAEAIAGIGDQPTFQDWSSQGNIPDVFGGELGGEAMSAYSEALAGDPVDFNPSGANFLQNVIPAIKESYVGTGAITGTEVGDRINRESSVMQESIANTRAGLYNQAKNRQATAAGNYQQSWANMNQAIKQRQIAAASNYQQQYQNVMSQAYDNYIKQNPDSSTVLQAALSYLNIPMMAAYQKPVENTSGGWNQ